MLKIYVNDPQVKRGAAMLDFLAICAMDAFSRYTANRPYAAKDYVGNNVFFFNEQVRIYVTHNVTDVAICNAIRNDDAYVCINYECPVEHSRTKICNLVTHSEDDIDPAISWVIKEWLEAGGNERTFMKNYEFHAKNARGRELSNKIMMKVMDPNSSKERIPQSFKGLDGTVYREVTDNFGCHYFDTDECESVDVPIPNALIRDFLTNCGFESTKSAALQRDFIRHSLNTTYGLTCESLGVPTPKAWDAKSNKAEKAERTEKKMYIPKIKHVSVGEEHKTGRMKTVIVWDDHTKTTVVCRDGETPDIEKGILMCVWEKLCGGSKTKAKEELKLLTKSL